MGFLAAGILHQLQDLGYSRIIKLLGNFRPQKPISIDTAAYQIVPFLHCSWNRLTGQCRSIYHRLTKNNFSIQWDLLAWLDHDDITNLHVVRIHLL